MPPGNLVEILRTKLYRPRPPERLLKRARLFRQVDAGLDRPVTLIMAPAGYGKTMLVSSWLGDYPRPACWVSLESGDDDLLIFLTYWIAAVQSLYPDACAGSASLLRAPNPPPIGVLQTQLVNELDRLPEKVILVLDDFHLIQQADIHNFLVYLVNHMPPSFHLVICTREKPLFPLAVWRARQQINEIGTRDLSFTPGESEQFLKSVLGNSLPAEILRLIHEKTEGWITSLQLVVFSLRNACAPLEFVDFFQKYGAQTIREFLIDQAFICQPAPIQDFLLKTSILERFSAPLCNALGLSGENLRSTQDTLDILSRTSLFIVPLDEQGEWFRYHNLFAEMLQRRLKNQFQPEEISDLHHRAMKWLEAHDSIDDAIRHALAAGDQSYAVQIVEDRIFDALNQEQNAIIDRWLANLPPALVETRPRLVMVRIWIESYRERGLTGTKTADLIKTQAMLDRHQEDLDPETRALLEGYLSALWPLHLLNEGKYEQGITLGERALKILPSDHFYVRGRALQGWALCMQMLGKGNAAVRFLLAERNSHPEVNAYTLAILQVLACIYAIGGKLDELEQTAEQLYTTAAANGFQIMTGWGHYFLGVAAYIRNDLGEAHLSFQRVIRMQYLLSKSIVRESLVGLCLVCQALGNTDEVQETLNRLNELEGWGMNEYQRSLQSRLALSRKDLSAAQRWSLADSASLPSSMLIWLEDPHFTQARIWVADGRPENLAKAVVRLTEQVKLAEAVGSTLRMIEGYILLACALYRLGKCNEALDGLEQAVQLAQPRLCACLFIEAGPLVAEMLNQIDSRNSRFVQELLVGLGGIRKESSPNLLLTRREIEVLRLLEEHLSEQDIANRLSISPDTVKKHCYHIYNKLGVNRRRDAVAVAKEAGIL